MKQVGIILAGGLSTRMKQDKALLQINGVSLLQRQYELLNQLMPKDHIFVSGNRLGYQYVLDEVNGLGPIEGLRSTLKYILQKNMNLESCIVLAVDQPKVNLKHLLQLNEDDNILHDNYDCITFENEPFPLKILNMKFIYQRLSLFVLENKNSFCSYQNFFKLINRKQITSYSKSELVNTNTPEEWHESLY